jgi:hypothetical protein
MNKVAPSITALVLILGLVDAAQFQPRRAVDPYATLPAAIRDVVRRRGCRPPRVPDVDSSTVAAGWFFTPRTKDSEPPDLAVACMRKAKNEILIFKGRREKAMTVLGMWATTMSIPSDSTEMACDGSISQVEASVIEAEVRDGVLALGDDSLDVEERRAPAHDGILDGDCDGVSIVHYWTGRRWVALPGGD